MLAAPTSILQSASLLHSTVDMPPAFSSHLSEPTRHATAVAAVALALRRGVAGERDRADRRRIALRPRPEQATAQPSASQLALQSTPALHAQSFPTAVHEQPAPAHVAVVVPVEPPLPQAD